MFEGTIWGGVIDILLGVGGGILRLIVGISGLIVFLYFAFHLVSIIRGPRPIGVLRHSNTIGVMFLAGLTFIVLAFVANAMHISGWGWQGRRSISFYTLVSLLSVIEVFLANLMCWKVDFSSDYIVEHRSFWRNSSVKWMDVLSWSLDDKQKFMLLNIRGGGVFDIPFYDVDGAPELFDALEFRGILREDLNNPTS